MRSKKTFGIFGLLAMFGLAIYGLRRKILARLLGLQPARNPIQLYKDLKVHLPDGVTLAADLYTPRDKRLYPTILIRTPYGRSGEISPDGLVPAFAARRFAERGYNVIVQDVRGRFDSGGSFEPFVHEAEDGRATLEWIEKQPWFNGLLGLWGPSYLGYVQWALAPGAPLYLKAMLPVISGSALPLFAIRDGAFSAETILRWIHDLESLQPTRRPMPWLSLRLLVNKEQDRRVARAARRLPLSQADLEVSGQPQEFYRQWLAHPSRDDPYWRKQDRSSQVRSVTAAVHLVSGWYDILLRESLDDFAALRSAGRWPYLTIGPWGHQDPECYFESLRQAITWFDAYLKTVRRALREKPVRIFVMGKGEWRDLEIWPPPHQPIQFFLHGPAKQEFARTRHRSPGLLLTFPAEGESPPDAYQYDPRHPTPSLGGALMSTHAGSRDNRRLEARPDVLTYTTAVLQNDLEIIGTPRLALYVRSDLPHTDFFGRLCDVHPDGRSMNVCDGLLRLQPGSGTPQPDGSLRIELVLWPTAFCFQRGHAIRLQVSSGAHPRWNRNLGSGEPLTSAQTMLVAHQQVFHDQQHPSVLTLPVTRM